MIDKTQRLYESLDSFLTEYKEKNEGNKYRPVAVGRYGIRTRESIYSKELAKDYSKNKLIFKNTLTVGMGSTQIDIGVLSNDATYAVSPAYHTYRINGINSDYLRYCLECRNQDMFVRYVKRGSRQGKSIDLKRWITYKIPVYPESVQAEIVKRLDSVKAILSLREQELNALDELIRARFVEMFGNGHDGFCNTKKLGEFCKFQQGTQIPVEEQIEEQLEGYTRFLRIIDYTQAPQIPRYVSVKGREIAEDSVVIVRYGATAGFVGHGYAGILANNLFEVVPDESILSKDFLYLALKYGTFEQEVHDKAFGAAMPALSFGMMNDIGVVTPNSTAQNGFVDFVKQVDKSKLLSGCRLFHSWAPENRDKPKHVGVPQRKTKVLRGGRRQQ